MHFLLKILVIPFLFGSMVFLVGCFDLSKKNSNDSIVYQDVVGIYTRADGEILERIELKKGAKFTQEIYKEGQFLFHTKGTWWVEGSELLLSGLVLSKRTDNGEFMMGGSRINDYKVPWSNDDGVPKIILDKEVPIVLTKIRGF
jgi:hypothetical protein